MENTWRKARQDYWVGVVDAGCQEKLYVRVVVSPFRPLPDPLTHAPLPCLLIKAEGPWGDWGRRKHQRAGIIEPGVREGHKGRHGQHRHMQWEAQHRQVLEHCQDRGPKCLQWEELPGVATAGSRWPWSNDWGEEEESLRVDICSEGWSVKGGVGREELEGEAGLQGCRFVLKGW